MLEGLAHEAGQPAYASLLADGAAMPEDELAPLDAAIAMLPQFMANSGSATSYGGNVKICGGSSAKA